MDAYHQACEQRRGQYGERPPAATGDLRDGPEVGVLAGAAPAGQEGAQDGNLEREHRPAWAPRSGPAAVDCTAKVVLRGE